MSADSDAPDSARSRRLEALREFPLIRAIHERRTRRVAKGVSVWGGPLTHESDNAPEPLDPLEEAILICCTGLTGVVMHDGPVKKPSGEPEDLGSMFTNIVARAGASPDNARATSLFMINDGGIFLLKQPEGEAAAELLESLPRSWNDWTEEDWLRAAAAMKVKIHDGRMEFPRTFPNYVGWNKQMSNVPGSTMFLPVVDCTRQYINILLNLASEPEGQRPLIVDDWQPFRPRSWQDWKAWFGQYLGLGPKIPYQPIGGVDRATGGFVNPDIVLPLGAGKTFSTDYEAFFLLQNQMLVAEAMGLGAWGHASVWPTHVMKREPEKGWYGLGFRYEAPKKNAPWAPVPASQPNPVGIDGILEGLCPPYVNSMSEAVDTVIAEKYGPQGIFTDPALISRAYRDSADAKTYLEMEKHHPGEAVQYVKDICRYIYETYGRYPAHVDAFYTPGYWLQCHHLETDYYDRFFEADLWRNQAAHAENWH